MSKVADPQEWPAERRRALSSAQVKDPDAQALHSAERTLEPQRVSPLTLGVVVLAILMAWLGFRVFYWNGYYAEDSPGYVTDAIYIALGNYHARHDVNGLNIGTYLPVAGALMLFGKAEAALSIWPMLSSLLGVVALGAAAATLFGRPYGLLAAGLYAVYPGDIFFSTVVMPDAIQAGWLSLSVYLIVLSFAVAPRRQDWTLAAGGVAMGICHLIRANDVILVPIGASTIFLLSTLWNRASIGIAVRRCVQYLSGWALVHLIQGLVYLWAAGDFLHRWRVIARHYGTLASHGQWGLNADLKTIPFSVFPVWPWWMYGGWGSFNPDQAYHALTFVVALLALSLGLVALGGTRRPLTDRVKAGVAVAVVWFGWPLLYHQFGSQSLTEFVPIHRLSRHLVVYAPGAIFATVAGSFLIKEAFVRGRFSRRLAVAAFVPLVLMHMTANLKGVAVAHGNYHQIKETYIRIREHLPPDVSAIQADPGDLCFLDFWLNPLGVERVRMVPFANYSSCDQLRPGVVLTHSNPGWLGLNAPVIQETVKRLPCLLYPPPTWRLLHDGPPEKIFVIDKDRDLEK